MKKLFIMIFPILVAIAVIFSIQEREYDFTYMINIFSHWDFADSLDAFILLRDAFNAVGEAWQDIGTADTLIETIMLLGELILALLGGLGHLILALGALLMDFVDNIIQIVEYLFFYNVG